MNKILKLNIFAITYISVLTILAIKISEPIYFATNDDGIMAKIASSSYSKIDQEILIYSSQIFGEINKFLYSTFFEIEWYGILQSFLVFTVTYYFVINLLNNKTSSINNFFRYILLIFISIVYINFITLPSFTIASIILGIAALTIYVEYAIKNKVHFSIFFIFLFFLSFSYLIRPDGFLLILYISLIIFVILFTFNKLSLNSVNIRFLISTLFFCLIVLTNINLDKNLLNEKYNWKNYFKAKDLIHSIHTNPSNIELNLLINNKQINGLDWTSVESTLLQKLILFDSVEFNNTKLEKAVKEVRKFQGVEGVFNYNFNKVILRLIDNLKPVVLHLILFLSTIIFMIMNKKSLIKYAVLILPISYLIFFYILSAVLRLPERITIPLLIMTTFSLLYLFNLQKSLKNSAKNWFSLNLILLLIIGTIFTKYGIINNNFENQKKQKTKIAIIDIFKEVNPNGIFIGDIQYSNENYKLAYSRESSNLPLQLPSGWLAFSPHWVYRLQSLNLIGNNPLVSVAQQENVYWVSNLYFSNIIDMYMNDHNILRKDKCEIVKLPEDGYIVTFQLMKAECNKSAI